MRGLMMSISKQNHNRNTKMKLLTLSLIAISTLASSAFADLGDTKAESVARYGHPAEQDQGSAYWSLDDDHTVAEWFNSDNVCDAIAYYHFENVDDNELLTKISQNIPKNDGFREEKIPVGRYWGTVSNTVGALLYVHDNHGKGATP
jgi:hypothetical protein